MPSEFPADQRMEMLADVVGEKFRLKMTRKVQKPKENEYDENQLRDVLTTKFGFQVSLAKQWNAVFRMSLYANWSMLWVCVSLSKNLLFSNQLPAQLVWQSKCFLKSGKIPIILVSLLCTGQVHNKKQ